MNSLQSDIQAGVDLLPRTMDTAQAKVLLYCTSRQENPKRSPRQIILKDGKFQPLGPAVGDYQFESGGGIAGVLTHPAVRDLAARACAARNVAADRASVFEALQTDRVLAAALARLLYCTDPQRLPAVGDEEGAWQLYLRTWRPGAYAWQAAELRAKWAKNYADALVAYGLA